MENIYMQIKYIWKNMPPILSLVCFVEELGMLLPMAIVSRSQTKCLTMQDYESYMCTICGCTYFRPYISTCIKNRTKSGNTIIP